MRLFLGLMLLCKCRSAQTQKTACVRGNPSVRTACMVVDQLYQCQYVQGEASSKRGGLGREKRGIPAPGAAWSIQKALCRGLHVLLPLLCQSAAYLHTWHSLSSPVHPPSPIPSYLHVAVCTLAWAQGGATGAAEHVASVVLDSPSLAATAAALPTAGSDGDGMSAFGQPGTTGAGATALLPMTSGAPQQAFNATTVAATGRCRQLGGAHTTALPCGDSASSCRCRTGACSNCVAAAAAAACATR